MQEILNQIRDSEEERQANNSKASNDLAEISKRLMQTGPQDTPKTTPFNLRTLLNNLRPVFPPNHPHTSTKPLYQSVPHIHILEVSKKV
jgi:hypothetical protein